MRGRYVEGGSTWTGVGGADVIATSQWSSFGAKKPERLGRATRMEDVTPTGAAAPAGPAPAGSAGAAPAALDLAAFARFQATFEAEAATRENIRSVVRDLEAEARTISAVLAAAHVRNADGAGLDLPNGRCGRGY